MIEDAMDQRPLERSTEKHRTSAAILVVDDDRLMRTSLKAALLRWGYSVDVAEHGVDALGCLSRRAYDVIITDLQMPMMDGVSLWRRAMVAGHPGTWILMTGSIGLGIECAMPVLRKPFRLLDLRGAIERAIVGSRPRAKSLRSADGAMPSSLGSKRE